MSDKKAIFLDRDGVLNELIHYADMGENESPRIASDMQIMPGTAESLRRLREDDWSLFLASNQPSYAKGKTSLESLQEVHQVLFNYLEREGVMLRDYYYCYCHPKAIIKDYGYPCDCRKPKPGMLLKAKETYGISMHESWMVGDSDTDILCGQSAGVQTILIHYPLSSEKRKSACAPDYQCSSLTEAVDIILSGKENTNETK